MSKDLIFSYIDSTGYQLIKNNCYSPFYTLFSRLGVGVLKCLSPGEALLFLIKNKIFKY